MQLIMLLKTTESKILCPEVSPVMDSLLLQRAAITDFIYKC